MAASLFVSVFSFFCPVRKSSEDFSLFESEICIVQWQKSVIGCMMLLKGHTISVPVRFSAFKVVQTVKLLILQLLRHNSFPAAKLLK